MVAREEPRIDATGDGAGTEAPDLAAGPEAPTPDTPMWRQYLSLKDRYRKEILFFRMGDFYEIFFDDARVASEILGIALTSRSKDAGAVPMAGVPVRAGDSYLPQLLPAGKRVAICEQTQDPKEAKGIVDRDVVRVISPGTVTDGKLLDERANNYICCLVPGQDGQGLAWIDVTTGEFRVWDCPSVEAARAEIARIGPAQGVVPEGLGPGLEGCPELRSAIAEVFRTPYPDWAFDPAQARRTLTEHFGTMTLEGFGCEHLGEGSRAAGGL